MVGVPYRRITHLRKHLALEFLDAGHILGSASVELRITRGRQAPARVLGRHRPQRPADHPRSRAAVRADRHADRRIHLRRPRSRVGGRRRGAAGRGGARGRRRAAARCSSRPSRSGGCRSSSTACTSSPAPAGFPRSRSTSTARSRWTRRRCSGCIPRCSTSASGSSPRRPQLFDFPLVRYMREVGDSKALNRATGPAIIIAASGMAESGRILHHLAHGIGDHRNLVLFVGFQAEHTLGRRIQERRGRRPDLRAGVSTAAPRSRPSAATRPTPTATELRAWVRRLGGPIRRAFVVHGEPPALEAMAEILRGGGRPRGDACRGTARAFEL